MRIASMVALLFMGALFQGAVAEAGPGRAAEAAPLVDKITPLSIRGVNYYPQETPWSEFWAFTPVSVLERDMALAARLNINTVRTFLNWDEKAEEYGLVDREGQVSSAYLDKFDEFLEIAWRHGIRVVPCFALEYHKREPRIPEEAKWKRAMGAFARRFRGDGRLLMWDIMNEPERHAPPGAADHSDFSGNAAVTAYLAEATPWIKTVDPTHLTTVGLGWRIDLLAPLGLPDVLQYHNYAPKEQMFEQGVARVGETLETFRRLGGDRPILIGEFGISTARDPRHGAGKAWAERLSAAPGTEAQQARLFEITYDAVEEFQLAGAMAWTLHSFPTQESGWLTPEESMYGLYRLDLTLKPAALATKERFGRWQGDDAQPAKLRSLTVPWFRLAGASKESNGGALEAEGETLDAGVVGTSFSMSDGVGFFQVNEVWNFQHFRHRPFLDTQPPWAPQSHHYVHGLDGDLFFFVTLADGALRGLDTTRVVGMKKKPWYMKLAYEFESEAVGGPLAPRTLEFLVPPGLNVVLYRWTDQTGGNYKFRTRVFANDAASMAYVKPDPPGPGEPYDFGRGVYAFDEERGAFIQTYENTWDDPRAGHAPAAGLLFLDKPSAVAITDKGTENTNVERIQASFADLDHEAEETVNTGKAFFSEHPITTPCSVTLAYAFADNPDALDSTLAEVGSKTFEEWKKTTDAYWKTYLTNAYQKIERQLGADLSRLSPDEDAVLRANLVNARMLLAPNGATFACPAAQHFFTTGAPGYYNSWIRDGSIAKLHLAALGLHEEYLPPHAALVASNYMENRLVNGPHRWWDVYYNHRQSGGGPTLYSQVDSAFYGIWSLYTAWKTLDEDHWVTGDRYRLMRDTLEYYRDGLTWDPHSERNVRYYDPVTDMFTEILINEADITIEGSGWPGVPTWYRSPTTGKRFHFVVSFYINVFFHANYSMMAEIAEYQGLDEDADVFRERASKLKHNIEKRLWREDKGRYIAGIAYNEDGYEDIDYDWENIGFDYIWALTLPYERHLPFGASVKKACLEAAYRDEAWANTVFGMAEIAWSLPSARRDLVGRIVKDACRPPVVGDIAYLYPYAIAEQPGNANRPQLFTAGPALRALCRTAADEAAAEGSP